MAFQLLQVASTSGPEIELNNEAASASTVSGTKPDAPESSTEVHALLAFLPRPVSSQHPPEKSSAVPKAPNWQQQILQLSQTQHQFWQRLVSLCAGIADKIARLLPILPPASMLFSNSIELFHLDKWKLLDKTLGSIAGLAYRVQLTPEELQLLQHHQKSDPTSSVAQQLGRVAMVAGCAHK